MTDYHEKTIENISRKYCGSEDLSAAILIGSVARRDNYGASDVDLLFISDSFPGEYIDANDCCVSPCEQAGGDVVPLKYLDDVGRFGSEPARWAFTNAQVLFSKIPWLHEKIAIIAQYPDHEQMEKMMSFKSQLSIHFSYLEHAQYSKNIYLLHETAVKIALFAGRLVLADNRRLYPNRKWFMRELRSVKDKPDGFCELLTSLLNQPSIESARLVLDTLFSYKDYPDAPEGDMARFKRDSERLWLSGSAPVEDW